MVEIDSYDDTIDSERMISAQWPSGTGSLAYGQTFRPASTYILTSCKFKIRRASQALTGNLKAYLYLHTGTFGSVGLPTGSVLETSDSLDLSTLTTTYTWYTFTFSAAYTLVANTAYCLVVYSTDGSMTSSNQVKIGGVDTGSHEGNGLRFLSSVGSWEAYTTIDVLFYVYGDLTLNVDTEMNIFPDNVSESVTAAAIEIWLDGLSITTLHKLTIQHINGFYRSVVVYV